MTMKKCQCLQAALGDGCNLTIIKYSLHHNISKSSSLEVLHDDPQLALLVHQEAVHEVDEVVVAKAPHHLNFGDDKLLLWLTQQIHLLDRDDVTGLHTLCHDDRA